MAEVGAKAGVKHVVIEAVVIRADGTREDLGAISDSAWSRFGPKWWAARRRIRKANKKRSD